MLHAVAGWWDGVELWLTQLPFALQVLLVVAVVGPACWGVAAVLDTVVERSVAARLAVSARRRAEAGDAAAPSAPSGSTAPATSTASASAPDGGS